jgi:hypothetical protein
VSQAAFTSLCDGVAESTLHKLTLVTLNVEEAHREAAAGSLARAISVSLLEDVSIDYYSTYLALLRTEHVKNLDFACSHEDYSPRQLEIKLRINRKWKPLLTANTPLGLWHRILEKAHTSPETSHGPVNILFYLLKENPDLVPSS